MAPPPPYDIADDRLNLIVRVTPGAARSALIGMVDIGEGRRALGIRLAARPVEGAANRALIAFLAARWHLARGRISIESGETGRLKRLDLDLAGADPTAILADLEMTCPRET